MRSIRTLIQSMALALAMAVPFCFSADALADKVTLKDGRVLEGEVTREEACCVWIKWSNKGVTQNDMFLKDEVSKIERTGAAPAPASAPVPVPASAPVPAPKADPAPAVDAAQPAVAPKTDDAPVAPAPSSGAPKAVVLTMGDHKASKDMVGLYMTEYALRQALPLLEQEVGKDGSGVVVLRVSSGGGALLEIQKISDIIHNDYKKKFRTVAWIESAISAAAMSAIAIEEIYFTPQGNFGACTGYSGRLNAVKGRELEEVLYMMEKISARGNYDPKLMRSMQIPDPLSATIDENGYVKFFDDQKSGKILVNRAPEILTLNERTAKEIQFSKGTAATIEELQKLMGYQELEWVGDRVKGFAYPLCKAEKWTMKYRDQVKKDEDGFNTYVAKYQMNIQAATQAPREDRGKFINPAREALEQMRRMVRNNPNFALFNFNMMPDQMKEWFEEQEKVLRDLMK